MNDPCNPEGTDKCLDFDNRFECQCREGFTGVYCETNIDECNGNPCLNGGTCRDEVGRFTCSCPPGWTGTKCETDIGTCQNRPCMNDATCIDLFLDYFCV